MTINTNLSNTYKYDTHVHTSEVSILCGTINARDTVKLYKKAGYQGICITDHYCKDYFDNLNGSWKEKTQQFLSGYHAALEEGNKVGLDVILGAEFCLNDQTRNDYLIIGITEKFLFEAKELYNLSLQALCNLIKENGMMIFQAHPMREGMKILDYNLLNGIEVLNGHPIQKSNNQAAYEYAKEYNLKMLAGSDCHFLSGVGKSGIYTDTIISNSQELMKILENNEYNIIGEL